MAALRTSFGRGLAAIAAAGLAVRLVYVLLLTPHLRAIGDSAWYHAVAHSIADGRGIVDPLTGRPTALHPPLLPLLAGLADALGLDSYEAQRAAATLVGAAAIVAIGLLGRRVAGERAGLVAAALAAVYPVLVSSDGALMPETLLGLFCALAALAAYRLADRPSLPRAAFLGALIALAALSRSEAVLLVVLLAVPVCLRLPARRLASLAVACAACALVIAPWSIRNAARFDDFVPLSTNEGNLIAGANCPSVYSGRDTGSWDLRCVPHRPLSEDESVQAAHFRRAGLDYARDHARRLPVVLPARVARTFLLLQPIRQARHAVGRAAWIEIAGAICFYVLALVAIAGAVVLRRRGGRLLPLAALIGLSVLASVLGYGVPRFRQPADVAIVVLAAVALTPARLREEAAVGRRPPRSGTGRGWPRRSRSEAPPAPAPPA